MVQSPAGMDIFLYCKRVSKSHLPCVKLLEKIKMEYEFCRHIPMLSVWYAEEDGRCPNLKEFTAQ